MKVKALVTLYQHYALWKRRRQLARLELDSGFIRSAKVRLLDIRGVPTLAIEDPHTAVIHFARLTPDEAKRLGRQLLKRARTR